MNIVSQDQWSGWFSGMGSAGVVMQNAITGVTPFIMAGLAIFFVYLIAKAASHLGAASSPEERREAKVKIAWVIIAIVFTIVGPTLILIFMNTVGKTTQTTAAPASGGANADLITLTLNALKIDL